MHTAHPTYVHTVLADTLSTCWGGGGGGGHGLLRHHRLHIKQTCFCNEGGVEEGEEEASDDQQLRKGHGMICLFCSDYQTTNQHIGCCWPEGNWYLRKRINEGGGGERDGFKFLRKTGKGVKIAIASPPGYLCQVSLLH